MDATLIPLVATAVAAGVSMGNVLGARSRQLHTAAELRRAVYTTAASWAFAAALWAWLAAWVLREAGSAP